MVTIAVVILLVFLLVLKFSFFSGIMQGVARPLWKSQAFSSGVIGEVRGFFSSKASLIAENNSLKNQVSDLSIKSADNDALSAENESLKELLGRTNKKNLLLGAVIERPSQSPYDTLVVDVGSAIM